MKTVDFSCAIPWNYEAVLAGVLSSSAAADGARGPLGTEPKLEMET